MANTFTLDQVKQLVLDIAYPVGSYFISDNTEDPSIQLGGGVWTKLEGKFLFSSDGENVGTTGGEKTHTLTIKELTKHNHPVYVWNDNVSDNGNAALATGTGYTEAPYGGRITNKIALWSATAFNSAGTLVDGLALGDVSGNAGLIGGSEPHNNMPPYYVTNIWRRTA